MVSTATATDSQWRRRPVEEHGTGGQRLKLDLPFPIDVDPADLLP
ncbi:hypothetical protein [Micromonospora humi]|nr:hypothetical protein [Micromonospora humi]